ncbi:hypothetical protein LTR84_011373 [Exophiala bonariae]|uniref:N,N-dimethylformamidase beta subunit-like C-terminal domain-containing protein n=1 Tax=Exophiala bonariae TaxID=1690606 RepID=A0AAV9MUN8_9EURO|nr:hypothetical protein LTR84_011373 [Exophiala bonariae]
MGTVENVPDDYPEEITGYADPWIAKPGDTIAIKVSCTEPEYKHRTVRVIQGVDLPHSPKKTLTEITSIPTGKVKGRFQLARCGSFAQVQHWCRSSVISDLEISLYFQPHLVQAGHPQSIISTIDVPRKRGFAIVINSHGRVELWIGTGNEIHLIPTKFTPIYKRWIALRLLLQGRVVYLTLEPVPRVTEKTSPPVSLEETMANDFCMNSDATLLIAASFAESPVKAFPRATNFFNGRIDSPLIRTLKDGVLVHYDFARNISEDTILDISGGGHHGVLVNAPTRAVRGHDWDGTQVDWTKAKYGYGAIHFHEDDLDDAFWETDFTITVPLDARSGIYAIEVQSTQGRPTSDMISFIIRNTPTTASQTTPKVALVLPTFTYLAYANDKLGDPNRSSSGGTGAALTDIQPTPTVDSDRNYRRLDLGLSTYDVHNDQSGNIYSSSKRPIMNLKPGFISFGLGRPRHLSGETIMIGYLEQEGYAYDILTDHDLHLEGCSALMPYSAVITGGHPEYPTTEVYDAYENYARRGGNLMYLGGNGFYWVTAWDPARPWRVEVRRGESGVRSYTGDAGEWTLSLNGQLGALWRSQGRSSHALFGVAFCSQGRPPGVPYERTEAGRSKQYQWMFEGIPDGELIGEFGLGGGASGDEMDSFDLSQGSPLNGVVVATSMGHPDGFGIASECASYPIIATRGTQTREIRSDIVYYETNGGGAVFSVGSINWYPSLAWDEYENTVAKMTGNVINEFLKRGIGGRDRYL